MDLGAAFILGLLGSLHCAGMCGPLALALPISGNSRFSFRVGRVGYNLGRISAYACLGMVFGLAGKTAALAGLQRWTSLVAGTVVLLGLIPATRSALRLPALGGVGILKSGFTSLLAKRSWSSLYLLGLLNGFLPCGLAYAASAGALAAGSIISGVTDMLAFGLGTFPMMLAIGLLGRNVQVAVRSRFQTLIPISIAVMGMLLIVRGLGLGIPYLSPDLVTGKHSCH